MENALPEANTDAAVQFLLNLTKVISATRMYAPNHPAAAAAAREAHASLQACLSGRPEVTIAAREGTILFEQQPISQQHAPVDALARTLAEKGLHSFTFPKGTTVEDIVVLAEVATLKEDQIAADGEVRPEIRRRFRHIQLNLRKYRLVEGEGDEESGAGGSGGPGGGGPGLGGGLRTTPAAVAAVIARKVAGLLATGDGLGEEERRDRVAAAVTKSFLDVAGEQCEGAAAMRTALGQVAVLLAPAIQIRLFGRRIDSPDEADLGVLIPHVPAEQRAQLLAQESLKADASPEELGEALDDFTPAPGDMVGLAEGIVRQIAVAATSPEERREGLSRFFGGLRGSVPGAGRMYTAVVVADDAETVSRTRASLPRDRFRTAAFLTAAAARDYIQAMQPDLVIAHNTLSGQTGLAVITLLHHGEMDIPLIVCSDYPELAQKPEVREYPRHHFLLAPVTTNALRQAVEDFYPELQKERVEREDLSRARQVQEKLLPASLPRVPRFDISGFYKACKDIGGDYYDLFPLSKTKYGILIADVSGKGVSGALVMVMFRSLFRMIATEALTPKEVMLRVNEMLAGDIRRGMFVTAIYMTLDTEADTLTMCSAGHNPAVFWRESDIIKPQLLIPSGMALGILTGPAFTEAIKERTIHVQPGDLVFIYTDGVVETMNETGDEFSTGRLLHLIAEAAPGRPRAIVNEVVLALDRHKGETEQYDDISILALKYRQEG
jgi:sigma-B regulation protein RsbU (phosphoserine phosphatase)